MAATPSDAELVRETIARLEQITADLDGYAERKARLIADVWIAQGFVAAAADTAEARGEAQRWRDCNTELGKRIAAAERRAERAEAGIPDVAAVRASERERCAFHLRSVFPADFLTRHGLHTRAGARSILAAAAAEIEGKPDGT